MRVVIQKVSQAKVEINDLVKGAIKKGFLILVGIEANDKSDDINWLVNKIVNLRVFSDNDGKMNFSIKDVNGDILLISQFTLFASTKKGNRPSFVKSAHPDIAIPLYNEFIITLTQQLGKNIQTGEFGANMQVSLTNNGPVTIIIDSKNKE